MVSSFCDGRLWWNWYSDGWLEQGGYIGNDTNSAVWKVQILPRAYKDLNYTVILGDTNLTNNANSRITKVVRDTSRTNSQFCLAGPFDNKVNNDYWSYWSTCGYAEKPTKSDWTENLSPSPFKRLIKY